MAEPRLTTTRAVLERGLAAGAHAGAVLSVSRGGHVIADLAIGEARPGVSMSPDSIVPWMSSGKPLTAVAVLRLIDQGRLALDDRVGAHIPEFTGGDKEAITVRHLLVHTAGLQEIEHDWPRDDWDTVLAKLCAGRLAEGWTPGTRAAYDPGNGWFVLGELVARRHGGPFRDAMRELVLDPCGLPDTFCGADATTLARLGDRLAPMYRRTSAGLVMRPETIEPPIVTSPAPGGNFRGPVRELARFYERLDTLLAPAPLAAMTSRQRTGLQDETFRHDLDFGLGVIVDSKHHGVETVPYGFGPHCSDRTFGHGGVQSSIAFRDPEHDLVVAWVANGQIGEPRHQERNRAINAAIYEDLGLATGDVGDGDAGGRTER